MELIDFLRHTRMTRQIGNGIIFQFAKRCSHERTIQAKLTIRFHPVVSNSLPDNDMLIFR